MDTGAGRHRAAGRYLTGSEKISIAPMVRFPASSVSPLPVIAKLSTRRLP